MKPMKSGNAHAGKPQKIIALMGVAAIAVAYGGEVRSVKGSTSKNVSIMDTDTWGVSSFSAEDDYIVDDNGICILAEHLDGGDRVEFLGNSLHVQASFQPELERNFTMCYPRAGLFLDASGIIRAWYATAATYIYTVTGTSVTVTAPDSAPAKLLSTARTPGGTVFDFRAPLNGAAGTRLQMERYSETYPGVSTLRILNACTNFFGTIQLKGNNSTLVLGTTVFPGTVLLSGEESGAGASTLTALNGVDAAVKEVVGENELVTIAVPQADLFEIGDLTLKGGTISFAAGGTGTNTYAAVLAVTNSLAVTSPVTIAYPAGAAAFHAAPLDDLPAAVTVLTLPVGKGTLSADNFTLAIEAQPGVCGALPCNPYLAVRTTDGLQRLVVAYNQPIVWQTATDTSSNGGSSFLEENKGRWSDGQLPGPGKHYFIPADMQLMTANDVPFTGESLTVCGTLALMAPSFEVTALSLIGGSRVYDYSPQNSGDPVLRGPVTTYAGADVIRLRPWPTHTLVFDGEVSGDGTLRMLYYEQNDVGANTCVRLAQINSSFYGRFEFGLQNQTQSGDYIDGKTCLRLLAGNSSELGGTMPAFVYNALTFSSRMGISALDTLTLGEQTRGIYVDGMGRVDVPAGKQLGLCQPFTWHGNLLKYGPGTLAIGGPTEPRFYYQGAIHDTPLATASNVMRTTVVEGGVKVLTTNALDGCELEIHSGASLVLDANPADADVQTYGFVNAKWDTPFVIPPGEGVPVTFDFGGEKPDFVQRTFGICTVRSDAKNVSNALFAPVPPRSYVATVFSSTDAATGLTTYSVKLVRNGLTILFR